MRVVHALRRQLRTCLALAVAASVFHLPAMSARAAAADKNGLNPDSPPTAVRFQWLRHEHQRPREKSPRVKPRQQNPFRNNFDSLRLAIEDLSQTFPGKYPNGKRYLAQLDRLEKAVRETDAPLKPLADEFDRLFKEALLANPLILPVQPPLMMLGGLALLAGTIYYPLGQILAWAAWPFVAYTIRLVELLYCGY